MVTSISIWPTLYRIRHGYFGICITVKTFFHLIFYSSFKEISSWMPTRPLVVLWGGPAQKVVHQSVARVRRCSSWWKIPRVVLAVRQQCCGPLTSCSPVAPSTITFHIVGVVLTPFYKVSLQSHVSVQTCSYRICLTLPLGVNCFDLIYPTPNLNVLNAGKGGESFQAFPLYFFVQNA